MIWTYTDRSSTNVPDNEIQVATFTDFGLIFVLYTAGDADLFLPYCPT